MSYSNQEQYHHQPFYALKGRIGRLRYLAYSTILGILVYIVCIFSFVLAGLLGGVDLTNETETITTSQLFIMVFFMVILIGFTYAQVVPTIRRLNDLNRSGWWSLTLFLPLFNLILMLYVIFAKGDDGPNRYGLPARPPSLRIKIFALTVPILACVGIFFAISLPAYQQYVERAKAAQIQSP